MRPERLARLREVAYRRQHDLSLILENVHDPHNISAVLRSCDSVGIREIFVVYTEEHLRDLHRLKLGTKTSGGAVKWVDVHLFFDWSTCMEQVRSRYSRVLATHLDADAISVFEADLTGSTVLLFGNEHDGVSEEALAYCDGNLLIPQMGMARSLNISVACAVTLFEAMRQRMAVDGYRKNPTADSLAQEALLEDYIKRHHEQSNRAKIKPWRGG